MSSQYEKARAIAEAIANRWDKFSDTAGVQWLADQIHQAMAPVAQPDDLNRDVSEICENCAGQKHTDMGATICPVCAGSGIQPLAPAHRLFMGPLAEWARSLRGRPVSTEKLAELIRICAVLTQSRSA